MRKILTVWCLSMVCAAMMAVPAKRGLWRTITLSDGTQVKVELRGDEHQHFYRSAEGVNYVKNGDGTYSAISQESLRAKVKAKRTSKKARRVSRKLPRQVGAYGNYQGSKKGLIILVNFKDVKFQSEHNAALYDRIANEENFHEGDFVGSMHDYFRDQSDGQFDLTFDVRGPVQLTNKMAYYGGNDSGGNDLHPEEMVEEACKAIVDEVNFKDYDWDGDGEVDQVYVVYAGLGEASCDDEDTVWPHAWELKEGYINLILDGVRINTYACGNELEGESIDGIGTMCHEFSHCLGYPDFYDIDYSGGWGMDSWDLMDQGSYNGYGFVPAGYSTWERWMAGWREPIVLSEATSVTDMVDLQSGGHGYIIYNEGHPDEYYILENRQLVKWDSELPGAGMLVVHVDYDETVWALNQPNDDPTHQRMTWLSADNKLQTETYQGQKYLTWEGLANDLYPYGSNNSITNTTKPAFTLYNKNTDGKKLLNKSVTNIKRNADLTMSFDFGEVSSTEGGGGTVTPTGDSYFYESFNQCKGTGGNDDKWNGTIASSEFAPDNSGWEATENKAYGANECAKFGASSVTGEATTPAFTMTVGESTKLSFMAGSWDANKDGTELTVTATGATLGTSTFTLDKGSWTNCETTITPTSNEVVLTFKLNTGRFFLDEVFVSKPVSSAVQGISTVAGEPLTVKVFDLQGRFVGNSTQSLPHGIYIIGGKKVIK